MTDKRTIIFTGAIIGILAAYLIHLGNPGNMGICVACFIRDIAGGMGLHRAEVVQNIRPEIIGFIFGALIISLLNKEFKSRGGSSPFVRFIIGMFVMIGALVFLGCPLRMVLRLSGGDLTAIAGFLGFASGIIIGTQFIKKGFSLGKAHDQNPINGYILPVIAIILLSLRILNPEFIFLSESGPGSAFAPIIIALIAGLIVGVLSQKSRICMVGGIRDIYLIKDPHLFNGFIAIFVFGLIFNFAFGNFNLGFEGQIAAHNDFIWNFLGMLLAGFGSVLLGGCPLRQTILAGEGNTDSAVTFLGLLVGGAISHNFGLAGAPSGVGTNAKVAVIIGIIMVTLIGSLNIYFNSIKYSQKGEISHGA
ncbi:YedE family putative selenium transporter [Natroniella acetigena]|uniref:YedE family putative selenium transporter n=1 Tax=Natroniella acetigena TaxID=52004 RepID=UPI002009E85F|nr:YedE family putative selenium transporter [Natroniella acetigena]MCK8826777.1 YedE family putative selenium transporter [Natroniella acetigena]